MQTENKDFTRLSSKMGRRTGLIIVILAAILLEGISAFQYYYTRDMLERKLELLVLIQLNTSTQRLDGIMEMTEMSANNLAWHAEQHLDDPEYMDTLVYNLVKSNGNYIVGAAVLFRPNYYPGKGYWFEPYARHRNDTVTLEQIGSSQHDYTKSELYQTCMRGDTLRWNMPYLDAEGAQGYVTTFAIPIRDEKGVPVAALGLDMSADWIIELVNYIRQKESSFSLVLSNEGELIAHPDTALCSEALSRKLIAMINDSTIVKEEKNKGRVKTFCFYDDEQGRSGRVYYTRKNNVPQWVVAKVCYDDDAFGELNDLRRIVLIMSLIGLLVLSLIIQLFARNGRKLHESLVKQERIDGELQIAKSIQNQMLPSEDSMIPDNISLYASLTPARDVGGDLYDFFLRDNRLFFCIGDVTGKGVPAALLMALVRAMFRGEARRADKAADIMNTMNRNLCEENASGYFVTMFVGVLNLDTGHLDYCNAGHEAPFIIGGESLPIDVKPNLPLGALPEWDYEGQEMQLSLGDMLFLYTDGLSEAKNTEKQSLGRNRVNALVRAYRGDTARQLVEHMETEVHKYVGEAQQSDDITLLAICWMGKRLKLKPSMDDIGRLKPFVLDVAHSAGIDENETKRLRLAVEEVVANVINHGGASEITIHARVEKEQLVMTVEDDGKPFDPTQDSTTDLTVPPDQRPPGGLGVFFLRKMVDGLAYQRNEGHNILTIIKRTTNEHHD